MRTDTEKHPGKSQIRIMTYNIRSCVDMSGRVAPEATADAIRLLNPDVVALQEVDDGIPQTGRLDQAHYLSRRLGMEFSFCPTVLHPIGRYGLAVLSRYRMELTRCGRLPVLRPLRLQQRGAVHAVVHSPVGRFHLFNTHLSLLGAERLLQIRQLTGARWLGSVSHEEPIIFCGDLNSIPGLPVYRRLATRLIDVQTAGKTSQVRARPTFSSQRPRLRLDYIFVSPGFQVIGAEVPAHEPYRIVSDHLPLCADLRLRTDGKDPAKPGVFKSVPSPGNPARDRGGLNTDGRLEK